MHISATERSCVRIAHPGVNMDIYDRLDFDADVMSPRQIKKEKEQYGEYIQHDPRFDNSSGNDR